MSTTVSQIISASERDALRLSHESALEELGLAFEEQMLSTLGRILRDVVKVALGVKELESLAAAVDPSVLTLIRSRWYDAVRDEMIPTVTGLFNTGALSAFVGHGFALDRRAANPDLMPLDDVVNVRGVAALRDAANRLNDVGDQAWAMMRDSLAEGLEAGESIPALTRRVQAVTNQAAARASAVARTETTFAVNAGSLAGAESIADYGGPQWKEWLATADSRTRPTHATADGQVVALRESFAVGGSYMQHPGDPAGGADETVNCRCSIVYREEPPEGEVAPEEKPEPEHPLKPSKSEVARRIEEGGWGSGRDVRQGWRESNGVRARQAMERFAERRGMDPDVYMTAVDAHWRRLMGEGTELRMRVPEDVLDKIIQDERGFLNQHASGTSKGMLSPTIREEAEEQMFGIPRGETWDNYPRYGYAWTGSVEDEIRAVADRTAVHGYYQNSYGDVIVRFSDDVKQDATFTATDSLGAGNVPSFVENPSWETVVQASTDPLDAVTVQDHALSYLEVQHHTDALTLDDVVEVVFTNDFAPNPVLISALDERGIVWRWVPKHHAAG